MRKTPPQNRKHARPTRDRACLARRPANSRCASSSATKSLRIHAAQCVALHRLVATKGVPSRELALILFQRHEESTNDCVASTLVATKSVPSSELVLILFQLYEKKVRRPATPTIAALTLA